MDDNERTKFVLQLRRRATWEELGNRCPRSTVRVDETRQAFLILQTAIARSAVRVKKKGITMRSTP